MPLTKEDLEVRCDNLRIQLQNVTEDRDELAVENAAIMRDFAIEGDTSVRGIIERYSAALCSMKARQDTKPVGFGQ